MQPFKLWRETWLHMAFGLSSLMFISCNNSDFRGKVQEQEQPMMTISTIGSSDQEFARNQGTSYYFKLLIADGATYVRQGPTKAFTQILLDDGKTQLSDDDKKGWQVVIKFQNQELPAQALGNLDLDLSSAQDQVQIEANFTRQDGRTGQARGSLFVDGIVPKVSLLEISTTPAGDARTVYWSAIDNYLIEPDRTTLYACIEGSAEFLLKSFSEIATLPPECAVALSADELKKQGQQVNLGALTVAGQSYPPARLNYYLYGEDKVGLAKAVPMTPSARVSSLLTLDTLQTATIYTNQPNTPVQLKLSHLERGINTAVDAQTAIWPKYSLAIVRGTSSSTQAFDSQIRLEPGNTDGPYTFGITAKHLESDVLSNQKRVNVILDRTPPSVTGVQLQVSSGVLDANTQISVSWNADDLYGIGGQMLEIQLKDETTWRKVMDANSTLRSANFVWGTLPSKSFSARISTTDLAGNTGSGISAPWSPQIFNAAVLTSSVECFYCHIRVEGDVAGINFPPDAVMDQRSDSGQEFRILGKLFATNAVPNLFKRQITQNKMSVTGGIVENYDNSGLKIFPSAKDSNGVPVFPALSIEQLRKRMNGTVVNGNGTLYSRVFEGNLVLTGTAQAPMILNGEFLVTGDLIIKGVYRGIGSIYANNVYIANDIRSVECLPGASTCPFPFQGATEDEKIASAKLSIQQKKSGLYLAGVKQTVIGGISPNWGFSLANPYSWFPETSYRALCTQGAYLTNADATRFNTPGQFYDPTGTNDIRARCEVTQVDAFLYGHDRIAWRSYGNFLINGGFVGYQAALLSTVPYRMYGNGLPAVIPVNPRNGMPADQNVIRYDWRLRAGGQGFESLKLLFDQ